MTIRLTTHGARSGARRATRAVLGAALAAVATLSLGACDANELLTVDDPDVANPQSLADATALPALRAGAISDLQVAMGAGGEDGVITTSALLGDEFIWAETFPTRFEIDVRSIQPVNGTLNGIYRSLQRARASAERASDGYRRFDARNPFFAEMLALAGFNYTLLAEQYCNGTPISTFDVNTGEIVLGRPQSNRELYQQALAKFDSALAVIGTPASPTQDQTRILNLIRVGRGRTLLNLDRAADAAAAVRDVPTNYRYLLFHSENSGRQNNGVFLPTNNFPRFSVVGEEGREGRNGLPYRIDGERDPRVFAPRGSGAAGFPRIGADNLTAMFLQTKYPNRSAPVVFADGVEARLIEAEQLQRTGGDYVRVLNDLRSQLPSLIVTPPVAALNPPAIAALPALTAPATRDAQVDQVFQERAYWMFLTGHRLGDMRRLIRQYGRNPESVFPSGNYFKGGVYGPDVSFPVPFIETNNPNFVQCTDRNA